MRCRYCGKELALLKRLTGGGGFCSEAHKQSYQDEYNQLALSRLLQAQKTNETESSIQKTEAPPAAPVAVEESAVEQRVVEQTVVAQPAAPEPVFEEHAAHAPATESAPLEISSLAASVAEERTPAEAPANPGTEPSETADFLSDNPAMAAWPDETPYVEPWQEFSSGPAVANWQYRNGAPALSTAPLVSLDLPPNASPLEHPVAPANLTPQEFANGDGQPTPPWKVSTLHQLPRGSPVSIEITASAMDFAADRSIAGPLDFETAVLVEGSRLLDLPSTGIEFPAEDAGVVVALGPDPPSEPDRPAAPTEDDSPRASLEALSRLHQDLVSTVSLAEPEAVEAEPQSGTPTPRRATELLDIAIRMFPPAKPVPTQGAWLSSESEPLLPQLKSLPLRPKVAVASGYAAASTTPAQPKEAASAPQAAPPEPGPARPAAAARPSARIIQQKQPQQPQPKQPAAAAPAQAPELSNPVPKSQPPEPAQAEAANVKPVEQPVAPVAEEPAKPAPAEPAREPVPNFGAAQLPNPSLMGSLKVKLGIAIALLVVACSTWLGWGGKSHKPAAANSAVSADVAGPSIIMGEGGWVEGWGGDPSGAHLGRQITIYRPSLKLSDYRIEFQANIDTKSIGWVFRATDPNNYYAMKLMAVSSGLSPKVALFKYLVINGRQTQAGRVPIDLAVQADTVFNIRTDVRGAQFSTYIQGQQVDVWTDDQLKAGGVGFLNEREERGKVKSVSIRYLNGGAK